MFFFLLGIASTLFLTAIIYLRISRKLSIKEEEAQRLSQEKQIVIDFMQSISGAIVGEKNRQKLFQKIIHAAIINTGAMSACIFEKTPKGTFQRIAVEGLFPPQNKSSFERLKHSNSRSEFIENAFQTEIFSEGEGLIGSVAKTGKPVLIENAKNDPRVLQYEDPTMLIRSLMVTPVFCENALIAILAVANPIEGIPFNKMDFSLLESLSNQVGLAIQNSTTIQLQIEKSQLDVDLQLAQNIQNLLLPSAFPKESEIDFSAFYAPAQKIGGDFYDVFTLNKETIGVVVADVSGKGIPASIVMAICQTHLKHLIQTPSSPAEILKKLNKEIFASIRPGMFITLTLGIIDTKTKQITIARAGHEAPIYYQHSNENNIGSVGTIDMDGMAIGMVPPEIFDHKIEDLTLPFDTGDILVFYTDGLTEVTNKRNEEFSNQRLMQVLSKEHTKDAQGILNQLLDAVKTFSHEKVAQDDQTILVVKHK
jgi:sigma-B regulation protein RsbU (phosphoserine phosphatase)